MTMKDFRNWIKENKRFSSYVCEDLISYYDEISDMIETLWKDGFVTDFSSDMLKLVNGFQINTCNYSTFHVAQTFDLHCIEVNDKATVKEFAAYIMA